MAVIPNPASAEPPSADLRGRLQVDVTSAEEITRADLRRLYIGAAAEITPRLRFLADVNLASGKVAAEDVYLAYRLSPAAELTAGYIKPANVADELTSDIHTLFLERSAYAAAFGPGRRNGAALGLSDGAFGVQAGVFGGRGGDILDEEGGHLLSLRLFRVWKAVGTTVHLGASSYREDLPPGGFQISAKPETALSSLVLDTGLIEAERTTFAGLEGAVGAGPFNLQVEMGGLDPSGAGCLLGGSAQVGYRFTGEERPYSSASGTFGRVSPAHPLGFGGWGALEGGLRLTRLAGQGGAFGGRGLTALGVVLNWYPVERVRLTANVIRARPAHEPGRTALSVRAAIDW